MPGVRDSKLAGRLHCCVLCLHGNSAPPPSFCFSWGMRFLEALGPQPCASQNKRKGLFPCSSLINPKGKDSGWPRLDHMLERPSSASARAWYLSEQAVLGTLSHAPPRDKTREPGNVSSPGPPPGLPMAGGTALTSLRTCI